MRAKKPNAQSVGLGMNTYLDTLGGNCLTAKAIVQKKKDWFMSLFETDYSNY